MNAGNRAVLKFFAACRAPRLAALAAVLLICAAPIAQSAVAADEPPGASQPGTAQPGNPQSKPKQQTAKSGTAKSTAKTSAPGAKPAGPQPRSLSGELLDDRPASDLDNQLLDGLPPAGTPPAKPPAGQPAAPAPNADRPPAEGPVMGAGGDDPLFRIGQQMRTIERRLEAPRAGDADTPKLQEQIVDDLARLIEKLEEQQNSQQSSASSKAPPSGSPTERKQVRQPGPAGATPGAADNRPAKESTERLGNNEVRAATADEIRGLMKDVWGQLPAREREQMLQSPPEQFLPKYELLLEKYYKRLADEQQHRP